MPGCRHQLLVAICTVITDDPFPLPLSPGCWQDFCGSKKKPGQTCPGFNVTEIQYYLSAS